MERAITDGNANRNRANDAVHQLRTRISQEANDRINRLVEEENRPKKGMCSMSESKRARARARRKRR